MALINIATHEIHCKIVYYGIGYCGKTTNLQHVFKTINPQARGDMLSIATETERTLFFDFLPLDIGTIHGLFIVPVLLSLQLKNTGWKENDDISSAASSQQPLVVEVESARLLNEPKKMADNGNSDGNTKIWIFYFVIN